MARSVHKVHRVNIEFDNQTLRVTAYTDKRHLQEQDPAVYERVKNTVFKEFDPRWAELAAGSSGVVVHGDVVFEEPDVRRIYDSFDDPGRHLIFAGNVDVRKGGFCVEDTDRIVVLGDLQAAGVSNWCGQLHVDGQSQIPGGLFFDSGDGGFTQLRLAQPVGLVAATANVFDITPLAAKYYFDPSFNCGFDGPPTNRHEEIMQAAFTNKLRLVTVDLLAEFFRTKSPDKSVAEEVANGEHWTWLRVVIGQYDARMMVEFFDEALG